ncbi:hypothetical protein MOO45_01690 [Bombilactobacillus folatiphilus]|uniref:DNA polymerase III subunit delta n=1 Tax=Bombilactobacillus folatiphilus TaxID=2923362 RepID=A0ABY4P9Z7_9LACO|nr:hypothetical protein [Bombilactobacillus folatiphilus]UQS82425.1 hypothetical protein MOO45_01690 [Bombilactobacillus folatiphilus]
MEKTITTEQPQATKQVANQIGEQRISHAYLIVGANPEQLNAFGEWFLQALFCPQVHDGYPCLACNYCQRISQQDFPDITWLATAKKSFGVDEMRAVKHAMEQTPLEGSRRVLVIEAAQKLTTAAANSLLKFLEDPSGQVTTILLANNAAAILPTILSRVQLLSLQDQADQNFNLQLQQREFAQSDIQLITDAHLENWVADLSPAQFDTIKKTATDWFKILQVRPGQAFINVSAKVLPNLDNQVQQQLFFNLLANVLSQQLMAVADDSSQRNVLERMMTLFLHAQKLWRANVSFENCLEQWALQLTTAS